MKRVRALLNYLSNDELDRIHEASLFILKNYGVRIESAGLRSLLESYGSVLDDQRVKFSQELVDKAVDSVKSNFTLAGPAGNLINIDGNSDLAHPTGGMPYILKGTNGRFENATTLDLEKAAHIVNRLDQLELSSAFVYPQDVPAQISQLKQCESLLRHSEKPIFGLGITSADEAVYLVELFKIFAERNHSGLPQYPGIVGISPISPLNYPQKITSVMEEVIKAGIPVAIFVAPIAGITAPLTFSGAIAQMHASMLAFTVISHLINPDTPLIYAARLNFANMKSGHASWGFPDQGIAGAMAAGLASHCGLISDVYGLSTASCIFDGQCGYEKMSNAMLPYLVGANIISGAGSLANLSVASLEQLVIDDEILAGLRKIGRKTEVDSETLALDVISDVITGGDYLAQEHTVRHLRRGELFIPRLSFNGNWSEWNDGNGTGAYKKAVELVEVLLAAEPGFQLPAEIDREVGMVMRHAEAKLLAAPSD